MNPANSNFYLSAFKESNHPQLWGLVFPGDKDITLGSVTRNTSVLPLPISFLPPWTFLLFYWAEMVGSIPFYLGSPQTWCRDNQLFPQDLYKWVYFEVWFHDRRAAGAIQETKAGVKQEENEKPQPHLRKHIWVHMKWAGTMVLESLPHPTTQLWFLIFLLLPPLEDPFLETAQEFMDYDSFSSCYY